MLIAVLLALAPLVQADPPVTGVAPTDDEGEAVSTPARLDRQALLAELTDLMRASIQTHDPYFGWPKLMKLESSFDTSYDWHSCIIAHWALLVIARTHGDDELLDEIVGRLPSEVLRHEFTIATDRPPDKAFLYPYDESWLLMLLTELGRHGERDDVDAKLITELRGSLAKRLAGHLTATEFPELARFTSDGTRSPFAGNYRSWLWGLLALRLSSPADEALGERIHALARERLDPAREAIAAHSEPRPSDFLSVHALVALVDLTVGESRSAYEPPAFAPFPDEVSLRNVHVLGMELSRVWPDAVRAASGDEAARARFEERVLQLVERRELWAENFAVCSHWMPQYLYIGLWLAEGRP